MYLYLKTNIEGHLQKKGLSKSNFTDRPSRPR